MWVKKCNDEKSLIQSLIFLTRAFEQLPADLSRAVDEFGSDSETFIIDTLFEVG
jgi:hypothetical protein